MENIQGKRHIPESSKKQELNFQRTGNYFHSVYVVFTTIYTVLGIINNLSRDELKYMGGSHWLCANITPFYTRDSGKVLESIPADTEGPLFFISWYIHLLHHHSLGVHCASRLQVRRGGAGPHTEALPPRGAGSQESSNPAQDILRQLPTPRRLPALPAPPPRHRLKLLFSGPGKWGNAGHLAPNHCTRQRGCGAPFPRTPQPAKPQRSE